MKTMSITEQLKHVDQMPYITTADREAKYFRKYYTFIAREGNFVIYWDKMSQSCVKYNCNCWED